MHVCSCAYGCTLISLGARVDAYIYLHNDCGFAKQTLQLYLKGLGFTKHFP